MNMRELLTKRERYDPPHLLLTSGRRPGPEVMRAGQLALSPISYSTWVVGV